MFLFIVFVKFLSFLIFLFLFCLFGLFCVWFYTFWWWAFWIGTFWILRVECFTRLTVVKFHFCLTLWTVLLSAITIIKFIKINRTLTFFTTHYKIRRFTLLIRTRPHRSERCWCKMKIWWRTKRTWTILESLMTKLTGIEITIIEMVIFCCSATFWTWYILLTRLTMDTLNSLT